MGYWPAGLLVLLIAAAPVVLPWSAELCCSTTEGICLRLKLLKKAPVFTVRRGWGKQILVNLLGFRFTLASDKTGAGKPRNGKPRAGKAKPGPGWLPDRLAAVLRSVTVDTLTVLTRYFLDTLRITRTRLEISGQLGLGDPVATGLVYGLACGLAGAGAVKITDLRPDFNQTVVEGEVKLSVAVIPAALLGYTVKTALHPAVRKLWFAALTPRRTGIIEEVQDFGS